MLDLGIEPDLSLPPNPAPNPRTIQPPCGNHTVVGGLNGSCSGGTAVDRGFLPS